MRLKSFHGPTLTDAMRQVREALGEDAIIVATRDDEGGGVRVTAAIDETAPPATSTKTAAAAPPEGSEAIEIIAEALMRHQAPSHLAEKLLATATQFANDDPVLALGAAFDAHFKFQPVIEDKPDKPLMLIGPPGAGKTLSVAKFATRATLGKRAVVVISTDVERAGGIEQLAAFTRLLKLDLVEIEDSHSLREAVSMQKSGHIYIDTAGRNAFVESERQQLRGLVAASCGDAALVLPAGLDSSEAVDMAKEFRALGATRLIITRTDMARRLGSVLRVAFDLQMPLANYSASSKVTEPLLPLNPVALARLVLPKDSGVRGQGLEKNKKVSGSS
jgi:flagellar biosynthesis protein FlhF